MFGCRWLVLVLTKCSPQELPVNHWLYRTRIEQPECNFADPLSA